MNEYAIKTTGRSVVLQWFADSEQQARAEAEACGHSVKSVRFVRKVR